MKSIYFITFVYFLIFTGCGDPGGTIHLKGKVLDEKTKTGIPGREIIVQALKQNGRDLLPIHSGRFHTDSSGSFDYSLRRVKYAWLYNFCFAGDSAYPFSINKLGITELKRDGKFLTFYLNRLADFTITIERKSKIPVRDTLFVSWKSDGKDGKSLYPYKIENYGSPYFREFIWIGGNVKAAIKTKAFADKKAVVSWELIRNGKKTEYRDTVFCIRGSTNYVNFKY